MLDCLSGVRSGFTLSFAMRSRIKVATFLYRWIRLATVVAMVGVVVLAFSGVLSR